MIEPRDGFRLLHRAIALEKGWRILDLFT